MKDGEGGKWVGLEVGKRGRVKGGKGSRVRGGEKGEGLHINEMMMFTLY